MMVQPTDPHDQGKLSVSFNWSIGIPYVFWIVTLLNNTLPLLPVISLNYGFHHTDVSHFCVLRTCLPLVPPSYHASPSSLQRVNAVPEPGLLRLVKAWQDEYNMETLSCMKLQMSSLGNPNSFFMHARMHGVVLEISTGWLLTYANTQLRLCPEMEMLEQLQLHLKERTALC